jgi:hypothetical protein
MSDLVSMLVPVATALIGAGAAFAGTSRVTETSHRHAVEREEAARLDAARQAQRSRVEVAYGDVLTLVYEARSAIIAHATPIESSNEGLTTRNGRFLSFVGTFGGRMRRATLPLQLEVPDLMPEIDRASDVLSVAFDSYLAWSTMSPESEWTGGDNSLLSIDHEYDRLASLMRRSLEALGQPHYDVPAHANALKSLTNPHTPGLDPPST